MSTSDSYIIQGPESSNDQDEIDSLPSSIDSSDLESEDQSDAQAEWEASLQQLELVLTMVIVPYAGKYFGRKFAYWSRFPIHILPENRELMDCVSLQVGGSTWSGCIQSRSESRIRRHSRLLEL